MKLAGEPKDEALWLSACILYANGQSVTAIAKHFGRDRTTVTRWLARAEALDWIDRRVRLTLASDKLMELSRYMRDAEKEARLLKLLGRKDSPLRRVLVPLIIPPLDEKAGLSDAALADVLRDVTGRMAAHYVNDLVERAGKAPQMGIAWGKSLRQMVHHIEGVARKKLPGLTVLPLVGHLELLGERRAEFISAEANFLASRLTRAYGGTDAGYLSVPAFLPKPKGKSDPALRVLRRYFEKTPMYQEVFGGNGKAGRIWRSRIIIVGVGSVDVSAWPGLTRHLDNKDLRQLRTEGAVGDACGQFFRAEGLHPAKASGCDCLICRTNDRVLGVHLKTLASLARGRGPKGERLPGRAPQSRVIAVASGRQKARAIIAACRFCVNTLIVDEDTAGEMLGLLKGEALRQGRRGRASGAEEAGKGRA